MEFLSWLARVEAIGFLAVLVGIVAYQVLTGHIRIQGMLQSKGQPGFDVGRLQVLLITFVLAVLILIGLGENKGELSLPSGTLLYVFGGSNGLYIVRKYLESRFGNQGG